MKVLISGGGTGGHIFPAIAIANSLRELRPETEILFIGAEGRMEMQRVPQAGYEIRGLPVAGFDRKHLWRNASVALRLMQSRRIAKSIIKEFCPDVAVGVGGYASGPALQVASHIGIPTLLQEQNSYAGLTNKLLARRADKICVAYEGMEHFFPAEKIVFTGNPVRGGLRKAIGKDEAVRSFGLVPGKKTILILGGSLGARTMNDSLLDNLSLVRQQKEVQFIWQTGSFYKELIVAELERRGKPTNLYVTDFISDMAAAYAAAELVVSRAGASSISELALLGKPAILVPSPNVAEDHQTKNTLALVEKDAALFVTDSEARMKLLPLAVNTVQQAERCAQLSENILRLARPDAAQTIAREVILLAEPEV